MISTVSQIRINQPYSYKSRISFRENETHLTEEKDVFEKKETQETKEKKADTTEPQYKFLFNFLLSTIALGAIISLIINRPKNNTKQTENLTKDIFKFESLKDNKDVPKLDNCASLNNDLRDLLEKQIKISKADKELLEEVGNPNASNRFILSGPTGVGKTFFSKVYAKTLNADYMEILFSDLNSKWVGEVETKMSAMFREITNQAKQSLDKKFVVTFNEIDSLLSPIEHLVGGSGSTHFASLRRERTVFLTHLEKLQREVPNVTVIGTTNMPPSSKNLDNATMGRFQNIIEVPYPNKDSLYEAIKMNLKTIKGKDKFITENDDKLKELAKTMSERRFSFRNLEFMMNEAKSNYLADKMDNKTAVFKYDYLENAQKRIQKSDGERDIIKR